MLFLVALKFQNDQSRDEEIAKEKRLSKMACVSLLRNSYYYLLAIRQQKYIDEIQFHFSFVWLASARMVKY